MAIRRPTSSRARINNNTNPMPPPQQSQRPKSVMSRTVSQRSNDDLHESSSTIGTSKSSRTGDDADTHIQVVLRCRGRSEREMQANSPNIVTIDSAKTKELTIETSAPVSSTGIFTPPPTRTYPFDLVFGPEATQSMIYHDIVGPMLNEVMTGYNCTLFAYGQTGTGKTYTMQGDLTPTPMGNPSAHAGIIPRVLFRLFHELEKAHTDYIVKVSFIELYNEELRDLLAAELAAPTTLTQPMGMASKDAKSADGGLKIFDDASKRGVVIQGLEEIAVKDSKDALALLVKGSERRQIAATKFNDHSSRSHSVFSLTVHIKETNSMGDDLLKVGKLNLVDLAGSENIGRSGAENKRAREAGMINQSLLTLGRVINALVDKASHIPYRESKLTRLLQDSLGGRTKTCIIATISPSRSNLEETLSTLDYALRAKSIRNKPEINQRMSRNSLLKEYIAEIELLKADLLAARDKTGFYVSVEAMNQRNAADELRQTELVEAKKQVVIIENQMRNVRDEYDQSIAVLKCREEEIRATKKKLEETEESLAQKERDLQRTTDAYEQEVVVRQAHQQTEQDLNIVATSLKNVAAQSIGDVRGLFEKLDRKQKVLNGNNHVVSENEKLIQLYTESLATKLVELAELSLQSQANLESQTKKYQQSEQESLSKHLQMINNHFSHAQKLFQQIDDSATTEDTILHGLKNEVEAATQAFKGEVSTWSSTIDASSSQLCDSYADSSMAHIQLLEESVSLLYSLARAMTEKVQTYLESEHDALSEIQSLSETVTKREVAHLRRQNEILAQMLVNERKHAEKAKADLLQQVSEMIGDFMQKRDNQLEESIGNLQQSNKEAEEILASTHQRRTTLHDDLASRNSQLREEISQIDGQSQQAQADTTQTLEQAKDFLHDGAANIYNEISSSVASHSKWVHQRAQAVQKSSSTSFEEHSRTKRARLDATTALCTNFGNLQSSQETILASIAKRTETYTHQTLSWIGKQRQDTESYESAASEDLKSIEGALDSLVESGLKEDITSGNTPRKRKWQCKDEWSLTKSREELLGNWKPSGFRSLNIDASVVAPQREEVSESKHRRSASSMSENMGPLEHDEVTSKTPVPRQDVAAVAEPLIDSRRRNIATTRPSSRRLR